MNIVLVCLNNFQEYILTNIEQLIRLKHENIYVLTNASLFKHFEKYKAQINLINVDELDESYHFYSKTNLDKGFRDGFWTLTSLRFFYIYEFMKKCNVKDVIHLENDVLIYYNCKKIVDVCDKNYLYLPFDTFKRNIASIMYIPNATLFKNILDKYDFHKNDMENFHYIKNQTNLIHTFPIFPNTHFLNSTNAEIQFVSNNFELFNCIFDAAAIGQYLGGVDPRNNSGNTIGFINETCVIKYNHYEFSWNTTDDIKRPFIKINDIIIPIFNLHIHHKNLHEFIN